MGSRLRIADATFDSTIVIDALNEIDEAYAELDRYDRWTISRIAWIEVLAGAKPAIIGPTSDFLTRFTVIELDEPIARRAAEIRRITRMKLPDAIIWATAQAVGLMLVTRNAKDFAGDHPTIRIPYTF